MFNTEMKALEHPGTPPIVLMGVPFDNVTTSEALALIGEMVESKRPHHLVTANVDFLAQARKDPKLHRILIDADLVLCDGMPLVWVSRFLGNPLPERVAGSDMVPLLMKLAARRGFRVFLLGASPESNELAAEKLRRDYPDIIIAGHFSPPFAPLDEMNHSEIRCRIEQARPDLLLVSFGCPKQEKWIAMHYRSLGVPVCIGVGATIDFLAGRARRAPVWMRHTGLEWVFRMLLEPRRLFIRYARDLAVFSAGMLVQWWRTGGRRSREQKTDKALVTMARTAHVRMPEQLNVELVREQAQLLDGSIARHSCVVDLTATRRIDSTGVALLLRLRRQVQANGQRLVLLRPGKAVCAALKSMRVEQFFKTAAYGREARRLIGYGRSLAPKHKRHLETQGSHEGGGQ